MFDLIIIGGGPAGSSASVYAARKQLKTLQITAEFGGQSVVSEDIQNWIGTISIAGSKLASDLKAHTLAYADNFVEIKEGQKVVGIKKIESGFEVSTEKGEVFQTKTILITTGSSRRKIESLGADRLEHKGLTYCASCDGPIFSGMDVAVIGGGNAAFETAAQLLAYTKSVTLLHRGSEFKADEITVKNVLANPKMTSILNAETTEIKGEKFVDGLIYKDLKSGEMKELKVSGIFVEIGQIPNTSFVKDLVETDEYNRIKIDPWTGQTMTKGIWAAGDCTNIKYHQNNIAAGDAVRALEDIYVNLKTK